MNNLQTISTMRIKGTFNAGWWNCYEHFAAELLDQNPNAEDVCTSVLRSAGITKREASWWLDHTDSPYARVVGVVHQYWLNLN